MLIVKKAFIRFLWLNFSFFLEFVIFAMEES